VCGKGGKIGRGGGGEVSVMGKGVAGVVVEVR